MSYSYATLAKERGRTAPTSMTHNVMPSDADAVCHLVALSKHGAVFMWSDRKSLLTWKVIT